MKKIFTYRRCSIAALMVSGVFLSYYLSSPGSKTPIADKLADPKQTKLHQDHHGHLPFKATQKVRGSLTVDIKRLDTFEVGEPVTYQAEVKVDSPLDKASFSWILPKEQIEVVKGPIEGSLQDLQPGIPITLDITLISNTEENQQIHVYVSSDTEGLQFTASDQFNTKFQEQLDADRAELYERTKEAAKKEALQ